MSQDRNLRNNVNALTLLVKLQDVEITNWQKKIEEGEEASI